MSLIAFAFQVIAINNYGRGLAGVKTFKIPKGLLTSFFFRRLQLRFILIYIMLPHSLKVHTFLIATFVCYYPGDLSAKSKSVIAGAAGGGALLLVTIVVIIIVIVFRFRRYVNYTDPYFFVLALILIPCTVSLWAQAQLATLVPCIFV